MSKSYCRNCDISVEGLYVNCPRCGHWLPPFPVPPNEQAITPPEPFTLASFGESWDFAMIKTLNQETKT